MTTQPQLAALDEAEALLSNGDRYGAAEIAASLIIGHLRHLVRSKELIVGSNSLTIERMNDTLRKHGVFDSVQWRHVDLLATLRDLCLYPGSLSTQKDVADLIDGARKLVTTADLCRPSTS